MNKASKSIIALISLVLIAGFLSLSCPFKDQRNYDLYPSIHSQYDGLAYGDSYPTTYTQYNPYYGNDYYPRCNYLCSGYPLSYNGQYGGIYETRVFTNPDPIEFKGYPKRDRNDYNQYPILYSGRYF